MNGKKNNLEQQVTKEGLRLFGAENVLLIISDNSFH
jgi:hypothetical protein